MISTKENNLSGPKGGEGACKESSSARRQTVVLDPQKRGVAQQLWAPNPPAQKLTRSSTEEQRTSNSQVLGSNPSGSNFSSLNKNDRFTNGTGATFEKLGNHTARIIKYPGKPWMVGAFYTFGAFNYVEKA